MARKLFIKVGDAPVRGPLDEEAVRASLASGVLGAETLAGESEDALKPIGEVLAPISASPSPSRSRARPRVAPAQLGETEVAPAQLGETIDRELAARQLLQRKAREAESCASATRRDDKSRT